MRELDGTQGNFILIWRNQGMWLVHIFLLLVCASVTYGFVTSAKWIWQRGVQTRAVEAAGQGVIAPDYHPHLVDKAGPVTVEELLDENILKIVDLSASDEDCNTLAWKCLGYAYVEEQGVWNADNVFPKWRAKYPEPVDLIGVTRIYDPSVDMPVRKASIDLMRAIPRDFKGGIRTLQATVGFDGFKVNELTPRITRRAQLCNFIMYYRERLHGKSLDELRAARMAEAPQPEAAASLPSERAYQRLRLDGDVDVDVDEV